MASVAAGSILSGSDNNIVDGREVKVSSQAFRGAAPDASIVMVKLKEAKPHLKEFYKIPQEAVCFSETDVIAGLKYVSGFINFTKRPLIICVGLGTNLGDHTGASILAQYIDELATRRNYGVVVCGGNEGNAGSHFAGTIQISEESNYQDVELRVGDNEEGFTLEVWGNIPNVFTVSITSPGGETIPRIYYRLGQRQEFSFVYGTTRVSIEYILVEQSSGAQLILLQFSRPLSGIWTIRVYAEGSGEGAFHMWLPIRDFLRSDTYFLQSNPYTTMTVPAYVQNAFAINGYNSFSNSFYLNSGRGFSRTGFVVPDLTSPGVNVSTVLGQDSGSSLAASMMAGALADFYQWAVVEENDILINTKGARSYFIRGASRRKDIVYPSREWGECVNIVSS